MNRLEFIMIMLSIIVGLGITELLTNLARQIRAKSRCKGFWIQSILVVIIFIALLQQWWESWGLQTVDSWSFPMVLLMLGGPVGLYTMSHLTFPEEIDGADLNTYYFEHHRIIWGIGSLTILLSVLFRPIAFNQALFVPNNLPSFIGLVMYTILALTKNKFVHITFPPIILVGLLLDILVFSFNI